MMRSSPDSVTVDANAGSVDSESAPVVVDGAGVADGADVLVFAYAGVSIDSGLDLRVDGFLIRNKRKCIQAKGLMRLLGLRR